MFQLGIKFSGIIVYSNGIHIVSQQHGRNIIYFRKMFHNTCSRDDIEASVRGISTF